MSFTKVLGPGIHTESDLSIRNIQAGIITALDFQKADGSSLGVGAGGTWKTYTAGILSLIHI